VYGWGMQLEVPSKLDSFRVVRVLRRMSRS